MTHILYYQNRMADALDILKRNHLSNTDSRRAILEIFLQSHNALAHHDIEKKTGEKFDRVTVYRTLQTFIDKGIVHIIPTAENAVLYALCHEECAEGHHHDNHIHFICNSCQKAICMESVVVPEVVLPNGFKPKQYAMVVTGICKDCRN